MAKAAASQWGIGFVLHRFRASKRTKHERVLIVHLGPWQWEWKWSKPPSQGDLFNAFKDGENVTNPETPHV